VVVVSAGGVMVADVVDAVEVSVQVMGWYLRRL